MMLVDVKLKEAGRVLIENVYDICQLPDKPAEVILHCAGDIHRHSYEVKDIEYINIKFTDD